jgi:hypothetical protein
MPRLQRKLQLRHSNGSAGLIQFLDHTDDYVSRELEGDREPDTDEPSLGSLDRMADQSRWAAGSCDDAEHEHDGREPDDTGIGDYDGLQEQMGRPDTISDVFG